MLAFLMPIRLLRKEKREKWCGRGHQGGCYDRGKKGRGDSAGSFIFLGSGGKKKGG